MTLDKLKINTSATILSIDDSIYKNRLISLGFYKGNTIKMEHISMFGDPCIVEVCNTRLAISKNILKTITVIIN